MHYFIFSHTRGIYTFSREPSSDHYTAERYKSYVTSLTKEHSGKDQRITIDDYFHIEDHREWVFFVGKEEYITPWWQKILQGSSWAAFSYLIGRSV